MRYALLVLEQPWSRISDDPRQSSVRPFLEGFAALNSMPVYYATYFDGQSFDKALQYLLDAHHLKSVDKVILYVAGHGKGARLGGDFGRAMNLGPLFRRLEKYGKNRIAGLVLDSCELGMNENLIPAAMKQVRLSWMVAYGASMDWMSSMLINLNLLQHLCQIKTSQLDDKDELLTAVQGGLDLFNPRHVVEILDAFPEEMEVDEGELPAEGEDEDWQEEEGNESEENEADADDEVAEITLGEGLTIALRYRRESGRFRTKILSETERWPALVDEDEAEDEA